MEIEKEIKNDFTCCDDFLSAEELVAMRKSTEESTANVIGSKFYRQTRSQMEEKAVEASMANFRDALDKKRATRICDLMQAKWDGQLNASLTDKLKGKYAQHMGRSVDGKVALSPEESMFLLENGCIEIMNGDTPMSTEEGFAVMLNRNLGVEKYKVYSHLAQLGFVVVSHQKELGITRYEKNMNLDKHQVKKRKATSTEIEEPNKKRLTFTGALSEEIKQITQHKDCEISLEDDDSVTECSSMAETSNILLNSKPSEEVKESEKENLNVECMEIHVQENVEERIFKSKEMENVDSSSVCSLIDEVSISVSGKTLNTESGTDMQIDHQPIQESEDVVKGQSRSDNSLSCSELFPVNELSSSCEYPIANKILTTGEQSFSDRLPSTSELTPFNELPSTSELTPIKALSSTIELTPIKELPSTNELTSIKEFPSTNELTLIKELPSTNELTPIKELPSTNELTPIKELPSNYELTPIKELTATNEMTPVKELPSTSKSTPSELLSTRELPPVSELPSHDKSSLELPNSKTPIEELPCTSELSPVNELPSHGESPFINELPSNSESISVKELTSCESSFINELPSNSESVYVKELTSPSELPSNSESVSVKELTSPNESPNELSSTSDLLSSNELTSTNASPSKDVLVSIRKPPMVNEQSSTNELPSISELLSTGGLAHVNNLTSTRESPSNSGLLPTIDLTSDSQLPFNGETPSTSGMQENLESKYQKQQYVIETRRQSMSASEKSDIEVMDVDSQSNDISDTSRDALDQERNTFGDSIHFLASGNSVVNTFESNENTDLDVLSCSSPKSVESDVLSLEPDSEDSFSRNDYEMFEGPKNDYEDEDVTLLEVTKKETKPLAIIDLLSEDDEEEESSGPTSNDSDDEISVVEVRSAPAGIKDTQSASVNPKKLCKKEEGSSSMATNSNSVTASPPKVQFPILSRKNVVCVARPPLNFLPKKVQPSKEAYVLELKPKIAEQQPRVWSSYRQMQEYQQMLRQRRQNPDFLGSREQMSPSDGPLQQHPLNSPLLDAPGSNLNNFGSSMDVNRNLVSYPPIHPMPQTSQINSLVSIRQQNISMVNNNFPPLLPNFPASVPLPNLSPGMAPAHILDQVQRTAYSRLTNMISFMLNQQQRGNDYRRVPPPMNSYNSYSSINGHGSGMHPNDVPLFPPNSVPPDFMLDDRRHFRRRRHTGKPFPCSFKGASNKRSWNEVKDSMIIGTEDVVSDGAQDCNAQASDGSDIEEVPITPTETLWDSPGVNPLVKSGVRHEKSFVLNTLQVTQMANLSKSNLNDRCFQESSSLEVSFDVYLPGFNFRKTSPGIPKHRIIVVKATDSVPRYSELAFIQRKWNDGAFLQVAFVDNGDVSFVSFNSISLPSLIPYES